MQDIADIQTFCQSGDLEAARRLLGRYESPLFGYLMRILRQRQDAEDVLQNTFVKALAALPRFEGGRYFKSWIFRIAHNEAVNFVKKRNRREAHVSADDVRVMPGLRVENAPTAYEMLDNKERAARLHKAIDTLPDAEREVVLLRLEAELPFKEIAVLTGAPLGTVLTRMHQAKQRLKRTIQFQENA